ncbi:uncharacterized protein LOC134754608 [Cydia strobilella]|uniref:uncharacterized protein LOC134754608 n=1 Tax=Cydia strobilella TaxID=1100964 RepID=UPI00300426E0
MLHFPRYSTRHCQRPTFAPRIDYQHIFHSAASMPVTPAIQQSEVPTIINNICTADSSVFAEHNYSVMSRSKRKTLDEGSNKREVQLKVKQLQMEDNRLPKRGLSYKHCRVPDSMTLCST